MNSFPNVRISYIGPKGGTRGQIVREIACESDPRSNAFAKAVQAVARAESLPTIGLKNPGMYSWILTD